MPKKLAISILMLASALSTVVQAQIHAGPQAPAPTNIEVPQNGVTIPMQDMAGRPVVEIKINGKGPFGRELSLTPPAGVQVASVGGGRWTGGQSGHQGWRPHSCR